MATGEDRNPGKLETYVVVNSVKDFAEQNRSKVAPQYREAFDAVCALLEQYEKDDDREWKDRSRELVRLILDDHIKLVKALTSNADTWKKLKDFIKKSVEDISSGASLDIPSDKLFADIDKTITAALKTYLQSGKTTKEETREIENRVLERIDVDLSRDRKFIKLRSDLEKSVSSTIKDSISRNLVEFRKKALEFGKFERSRTRAVPVPKAAKTGFAAKIGERIRSLGLNAGKAKTEEGKKTKTRGAQSVPSLSVAFLKKVEKFGNTLMPSLRKSLKGLFTWFGSKLVSIAAGAIKLIKGAFTLSIKSLGWCISKTLGAIMWAGGKILELARNAITGAISVVGNIFRGAVNLVVGAWKAIRESSLFNTIFELMIGSGGFMLGFMLGKVVMTMASAIKNAWNATNSGVRGKMEDIKDEIIDGGEKFDEILGALGNWTTEMTNSISNIFSDIGFVVEDIWSRVFGKDGLVESIAKYIPDVKTMQTIGKCLTTFYRFTGGVGGAIARSLPGIWKVVAYIVNAIFLGVSSLFKGRKNTHIDIVERHMGLFNAATEKDISGIAGMTDETKNFLTEKRNRLGDELAEIGAVENTWNNEIVPGLQRGKPISLYSRFIQRLLSGSLLGVRKDFTKPYANMILEADTISNNDQRIEYLGNIVRAVLMARTRPIEDILKEFSELGNMNDVENLEYNMNYLINRAHEEQKARESGHIPQPMALKLTVGNPLRGGSEYVIREGDIIDQDFLKHHVRTGSTTVGDGYHDEKLVMDSLSKVSDTGTVNGHLVVTKEMLEFLAGRKEPANLRIEKVVPSNRNIGQGNSALKPEHQPLVVKMKKRNELTDESIRNENRTVDSLATDVQELTKFPKPMYTTDEVKDILDKAKKAYSDNIDSALEEKRSVGRRNSSMAIIPLVR